MAQDDRAAAVLARPPLDVRRIVFRSSLRVSAATRVPGQPGRGEAMADQGLLDRLVHQSRCPSRC